MNERMSSIIKITIKNSNYNYFTTKVVCDSAYFVKIGQQEQVEHPIGKIETELLEINGESEITIFSEGKITKFECVDQIAELDISRCPSIEVLECFFHTLKTLDLSKNPALRVLNCSHGRLESLDISNNYNITKLNCSNNYIQFLNVTHLNELTYLDCSVNEINSLDISNNKKLLYLNVMFNLLQTLDCSKNTEIIELRIEENNIQAIDLRNNLELHEGNCSLEQRYGGTPRILYSYYFKSSAAEWWLQKIENVDEFALPTTETPFIDDMDEEPKKIIYRTPEEQCNLFVSERVKKRAEDFPSYQELISFSLAPPYFMGITIYFTLKTQGDFAIDFGDGVLVEYSPERYFKELYGLIKSSYGREYCSDEDLQSYPKEIEINQKSKGRKITIYGKQYITHIDFSGTKSLESIDVRKNKGLESLGLEKRYDIKSLDLSENYALKYLDCSSTKVSELDLTNNTQLETLKCSNTDIIELDLSNHTLLKELYCSNTSLITIDLRNNSKLTTLSLNDCSFLKKITLHKDVEFINTIDNLGGLMKDKSNTSKDIVIFRKE